MTKVVLYLAIVLACSGCGRSITAPDPIQPAPTPVAELATVSGRVYASAGPMYPPIGGAVIEVSESDGTSKTAVSDASGFYRIAARRGSLTITASKDGYGAKQWQFDLLTDTALNFSLDTR